MNDIRYLRYLATLKDQKRPLFLCGRDLNKAVNKLVIAIFKTFKILK